MPRAANWIILAVVTMVLVSPLAEFFDKTDAWSADGSDFAFYIICLFCFLALSARRSRIFLAKLACPQVCKMAPPAPQSFIERIPNLAPSEERSLFLSFCDLRI